MAIAAVFIEQWQFKNVALFNCFVILLPFCHYSQKVLFFSSSPATHSSAYLLSKGASRIAKRKKKL